MPLFTMCCVPCQDSADNILTLVPPVVANAIRATALNEAGSFGARSTLPSVSAAHLKFCPVYFSIS